MERSPFLPLPEGMVLGQAEISEAQLMVEVISTQPCTHYPGCRKSSELFTVSISERFTTFPAGAAAWSVGHFLISCESKCSTPCKLWVRQHTIGISGRDSSPLRAIASKK